MHWNQVPRACPVYILAAELSDLSYFNETGVLNCSHFFIIGFLHLRFLTLSGIPNMQ